MRVTSNEFTTEGSRFVHTPTGATVSWPYAESADMIVSEGLGEGDYELADIVSEACKLKRLLR